VIRAGRQLAIDELVQRPGALARVQAISTIKLGLDHSAGAASRLWGITYTPTGLLSSLRADTPVARPGNAVVLVLVACWIALNAALLIGALIGCVAAARRRAWKIVIPCGLTMLLLTIATGSVGLERFRLPLMLPLLVLCAYGWSSVRESPPS
jgi:hypothetical protein